MGFGDCKIVWNAQRRREQKLPLRILHESCSCVAAYRSCQADTDGNRDELYFVIEDAMKYIVLFLLGSLPYCAPASAVTCESLAGLSLPHGKITAAIAEPGGTLVGLTSEPIGNLPAFCRIAATLTPSDDSDIKIEVWMPSSGWNGKYEGTGNGGYAGSIQYRDLAAGLRRGYAVANTDMGTSPSTMEDGDALIRHPQKWMDWGERSTHEMTIAAKKIIRAYYGRGVKQSYFVGCSTGGQQGLLEAQQFPEDYDGIIAGAPANDRTRLHMSILWDFVVAEKDAANYIPASKLPLLSDAVLNACRTQKAVTTDPFLSNPPGCHWDPQALQCKSEDGPGCLTAEQVATARNLYGGPRNPLTHASIYPGLTRGSEFDWGYLMPENGEPRFDALFKWTLGRHWDWRTFDFARDVTAVDARLARILNATDPDLRTFRAQGHKLIVYHGWADVLVPSWGSIDYDKSVQDKLSANAANGRRGDLEVTQDFYRLFMVPGMAHCSGGPGLNQIDAVESLERWVEKGEAPERIVAQRIVKGVTEMTRPICPYPKTTQYNGTGDTNDAANFSCISPKQADDE